MLIADTILPIVFCGIIRARWVGYGNGGDGVKGRINKPFAA